MTNPRNEMDGLVLRFNVARIVFAEEEEEEEEAHTVVSLLDITERKRAEEELARSNCFIAALSKVGARLQTSLVPDRIMETLGAELKQLGLTCAVVLTAPEGATAVVRYTSFESRTLELAEQLAGVTVRDLHLPRDRFLRYDQIIKHRRGVFEPDILTVVGAVLPGIAKPLLEQATRLIGITHETPAILVPLEVEDRALGTLNIWGEGLKETDIPAVSVFASQVAMAMQNARLFRALDDQRDQLRALTARLQEVEETERRRLARELHDRLGQNLGALSINLSIIQSQLPAEAAPMVGTRLTDSLTLVADTVEHVRDVMSELRPPVLDDYGLLAALHWYAERFSQRTTIATVVQETESTPRLSLTVETTLFRIAQEALTNVSKHACAKQATVTLESVGDRARLTIADDGVGFDPAHLTARAAPCGWGMITMRERAEAVGGQMRVESAPGKGTRVVIEVGRGG